MKIAVLAPEAMRCGRNAISALRLRRVRPGYAQAPEVVAPACGKHAEEILHSPAYPLASWVRPGAERQAELCCCPRRGGCPPCCLAHAQLCPLLFSEET